jgi:hypothetical protein
LRLEAALCGYGTYLLIFISGLAVGFSRLCRRSQRIYPLAMAAPHPCPSPVRPRAWRNARRSDGGGDEEARKVRAGNNSFSGFASALEQLIFWLRLEAALRGYGTYLLIC